MTERIEAKIRAVEQDIEAIRNGEMLAIHDAPTDKKLDESQAIELQEWRIVQLRKMLDRSYEQLADEFYQLKLNKLTFESAVLLDLYRIALGVM